MPFYFVAREEALGCFIYLYRDIAVWTSRGIFILVVALGQTLFLQTKFSPSE